MGREAALRSAAIVMSPALGDTLNLLVVAHNLSHAGWHVQVFGDHAYALAAWFPHLSIAPALTPSDAREVLARFGAVVQQHRDRPLKDVGSWHPGFIDLHEVEYAANGNCMAKRFADFAAAHFGLEHALISNGMQAPAGVTFRKHAARVAVHPEASSGDKRWLTSRFIELARRLRAANLSVEFTMLARERPHWLHAVSDVASLRIFPSTAALAEWLYESGWFIGNDSGVGHLASSLGIPTLTVFRRRRIAERWRPGFTSGTVVVPPWWVPTAAMKERWWRESISVRRVLEAFSRLRSCDFALTANTNVTPISKP